MHNVKATMISRTLFLPCAAIAAASLAHQTSAFTAPPQVAIVSRVIAAPSKPAFFACDSSSQQRRPLLAPPLHMSEGTEKPKSNLPMLLDPGTRGGAVFLSLLLFIAPIIGYEIATIGFGYDGIEAGKWIGVGFTLVTLVLWVSTYILRVATKDMTYVRCIRHGSPDFAPFGYSSYVLLQDVVLSFRSRVSLLSALSHVTTMEHLLRPDCGQCIVTNSQAKQLKDYENAVIAKRLEELDDDEVQALVEDIERDSF